MNSACWPLAVCATTHGAILFTTFTGLPPTRWPVASEEPIAINATMPAATNKGRHRTSWNRDHTNLLFRLVAMEVPYVLSRFAVNEAASAFSQKRRFKSRSFRIMAESATRYPLPRRSEEGGSTRWQNRVFAA